MTREEFQAGLDQFADVQDHDVLKVVRERGYSLLSCALLRKLLEDPPEATQPVKPDPPVDRPEGDKDPRLTRLHIRKRDLFNQRAKLSNKFHDCSTDQERDGISKQVEAVQDRIEKVFRDIEHFDRFGEPKQEKLKFEPPADKAKCVKMLNSTRSYLSKVKRELEAMEKLPQAKQDAKRLVFLRNKFDELTVKKSILEHATKAG